MFLPGVALPDSHDMNAYLIDFLVGKLPPTEKFREPTFTTPPHHHGNQNLSPLPGWLCECFFFFCILNVGGEIPKLFELYGFPPFFPHPHHRKKWGLLLPQGRWELVWPCEQREPNPVDIPLYWLVDRDPYSGLL